MTRRRRPPSSGPQQRLKYYAWRRTQTNVLGNLRPAPGTTERGEGCPAKRRPEGPFLLLDSFIFFSHNKGRPSRIRDQHVTASQTHGALFYGRIDLDSLG